MKADTQGFTPFNRSAENGFTPFNRSAENGFMPFKRFAENGFTPLRRLAENGFTLVEVVIALFIFAMIAAASVALLGFSVRAQSAASDRLDVIASERRLSALLSADLGQAIARTVRDQSGATLPAFEGTGGGTSGLLARYVRGGWTNPDGAPRPALQRVELRIDNGRLTRRSFTMLDGATLGSETVLASKLKDVRVRYRDKFDWRDRWTPERADSLPRALELTLDREHGAPVLLAFIVGVPQ